MMLQLGDWLFSYHRKNNKIKLCPTLFFLNSEGNISVLCYKMVTSLSPFARLIIHLFVHKQPLCFCQCVGIFVFVCEHCWHSFFESLDYRGQPLFLCWNRRSKYPKFNPAICCRCACSRGVHFIDFTTHTDLVAVLSSSLTICHNQQEQTQF